jgi:hypothetical protein
MMGPDGFDHFNDDDFNYDDGLPHDLRIAPETGHIGLVGQAAILEVHDAVSARYTPKRIIVEEFDPPEELFDLPAVEEEPADLLWTPIARLIMSPTRYRAEWLSHVSDMNYERYEYQKRGNLFGAHLAVIRAHFYSLPVSWLLIPCRFVFHVLRHWFGF